MFLTNALLSELNTDFRGNSFPTAYTTPVTSICVEADCSCQSNVLNTDTITDTETALELNHYILYISTCIFSCSILHSWAKTPTFLWWLIRASKIPSWTIQINSNLILENAKVLHTCSLVADPRNLNTHCAKWQAAVEKRQHSLWFAFTWRWGRHFHSWHCQHE